jgi:hypothetical protein
MHMPYPLAVLMTAVRQRYFTEVGRKTSVCGGVYMWVGMVTWSPHEMGGKDVLI